MKVTACLITYKRQYNIPIIMTSLLKYPFITQIMVRDNSKCENIINYGRYTQALQAENDIIYTQDDDCVVPNIDALYTEFRKDPTRIVHGGPENYRPAAYKHIYRDSHMVMAGWGSFFDRRWIPALDAYTKVYGTDHTFYRETDRIFSMLLNKRHTWVLSDVLHLRGYMNDDALSSQWDHIRQKRLAVMRCIKLLYNQDIVYDDENNIFP